MSTEIDRWTGFDNNLLTVTTNICASDCSVTVSDCKLLREGIVVLMGICCQLALNYSTCQSLILKENYDFTTCCFENIAFASIEFCQWLTVFIHHHYIYIKYTSFNYTKIYNKFFNYGTYFSAFCLKHGSIAENGCMTLQMIVGNDLLSTNFVSYHWHSHTAHKLIVLHKEIYNIHFIVQIQAHY